MSIWKGHRPEIGECPFISWSYLANEIQSETSWRGKRRTQIRSLTLIITYQKIIVGAVGYIVSRGTYFL